VFAKFVPVSSRHELGSTQGQLTEGRPYSTFDIVESRLTFLYRNGLRKLLRSSSPSLTSHFRAARRASLAFGILSNCLLIAKLRQRR
jgi:hypothetical protein